MVPGYFAPGHRAGSAVSGQYGGSLGNGGSGFKQDGVTHRLPIFHRQLAEETFHIFPVRLLGATENRLEFQLAIVLASHRLALLVSVFPLLGAFDLGGRTNQLDTGEPTAPDHGARGDQDCSEQDSSQISLLSWLLPTDSLYLTLFLVVIYIYCYVSCETF